MSAYLEMREISYDIMFTTTFDEVSSVRESTDFAIILGGDGTVLSCARFLHSREYRCLRSISARSASSRRWESDEWKEAFELGEKARLMYRGVLW